MEKEESGRLPSEGSQPRGKMNVTWLEQRTWVVHKLQVKLWRASPSTMEKASDVFDI